MKKIFPILLSLAVLSGCASHQELFCPISENTTDGLYQVSTLDALAQGAYDGILPFNGLLKHGNTGLGTIHSLDGELIVLDGKAYQATNTGKVHVLDLNLLTPFSCVTTFVPDITLKNLKDIQGIDGLKSLLNHESLDATANRNLFYMVKIKGNFPQIQVRSVPAQQKPYPMLADVEQQKFTYNDVQGTLVALYCPPYMSGLNLAGWHIHFLSDDLTKGGHVLDLTMTDGSGEVDIMTAFEMLVPNTPAYARMDLTRRMDEQVAAVEGGK